MIDSTAPNDDLTPDEESARQERLDRLAVFSETIKKLRQEAIDGRMQMGIDDQWQEDEDFYEAIDDANRTTAPRTKPYDFGGTGTGPTRMPTPSDNRSSIFVPMTRPYVDMASALIADLYLPTDDRNWDGEPTPIPELIEQAKDLTPLIQAVAPNMAQGLMGEPAQGMAPQAPAQTVGDLAQQEIDKAEKAWEKARNWIDDQLLECAYNGEMRKVIKDMARIGVGIMKGPFPKSKTSKAVVNGPGGYAIEIQKKIVPASKRIDPWHFWPDPACGEDVRSGSYTFEDDSLTRKKLRDLKKIGGYIESQIDACLEEGPKSGTLDKKDQKGKKNDSDLFQIWYFEGEVEWQDLIDAGCEVEGEKGDVFHAVVTMVNDRVIKAALSHLDSEEYTYDVVVWQRKSGLWIGDGVARQGRTAQRGLNAAVRNLMDNAGKSSRPHTVLNRQAITPGPDPWTWYMKGDADVSQVEHAMMFFNVPSTQKEMMEIIQYYSKMFEDATGLPMMMQGQKGDAPDTVGGMELLMQNAGIVPRDIVRRIDDSLTEPHIKRYYEYLLIHGEDDSAKGEFSIHARGSSALMERAAQDQFLLQLAEYVGNPAFGLDPELYIDELLRSKRINPQRLKLTDEKKKELASRQPPEDPRITAAKIMAGAGIQKVQEQGKIDGQLQAAESQAELAKIQFESEHEQQMLLTGGAQPHQAQAIARIEQEKIRAQTAQAVEESRAAAEAARAQKEYEIAQQNGQFKLQEMQLQKEILLLEYANKRDMQLNDVKAELAKQAIDTQTKRELAAAEIQLSATQSAEDRQHEVMQGAADRNHDLTKHVMQINHDAKQNSLVRDEISTKGTP